MNRLRIAQYIAAAATIMSVTGFILNHRNIELGEILILLGLLTGLASYLFGGLFKMIGMALEITKVGLLAVPFPYNLVTCPAVFLLAVLAFLFVPIIPVRKAYLESGGF
jgi:hypothetical protein